MDCKLKIEREKNQEESIQLGSLKAHDCFEYSGEAYMVIRPYPESKGYNTINGCTHVVNFETGIGKLFSSFIQVKPLKVIAKISS